MTLKEIFAKHQRGDWPDKGTVHSYLDIYEVIMEPYRYDSKNVLEIGLMSGESLRSWTEYFPNSNVYGIDCDLKPINGMADLTEAIHEGYKICLGDASNPTDVEKHFKGIKFDVIIEDGPHNIESQLKMYEVFKPYLAKGALYVVEDVQNIESTFHLFKNIDPDKEVSIIDLRHIKGRYDDILVIIKDKE